jgi:transposase
LELLSAARCSGRGFQNLKDNLALRPIHHQRQERIEAHIFIAFLAYRLHATLRCRLQALAPGLTPGSVLDKFAAVQMIDVHIPTPMAAR